MNKCPEIMSIHTLERLFPGRSCPEIPILDLGLLVVLRFSTGAFWPQSIESLMTFQISNFSQKSGSTTNARGLSDP